MCDLDRRTFLTVATGAGLGVALAACAGLGTTATPPPTASATEARPTTAAAPPQAPIDNLPDPGLRKVDPAEFRRRPLLLRRANVVDVTRGVVRNTFRARKEFPELRPDLERALRNAGKLHAAGVPFGFGTDTGVGNRVPGFYEHRELELLVGAGVAPIDALRMATVGSAEIIGQKGVLGEIAPGRRADMVVLRANPLQNIRNTRTVESVWLDGVQACGGL